MSGEPGLRERKKQRTRAAIAEAAIALFLEHGFNQVSVAQVAEAAEVSKRTLFAYFATKEDLVVHRFADHEAEAARVVRGRAAHTAPLTALRRHFLAGLRERDPVTGLNDTPEICAFYRMVFDTPALAARREQFRTTAEQALAEALRETAGAAELSARLAAGQIITVHWTLADDNATRLAYGESADERYPAALEAAEHAFWMLDNGVSNLSGPRGAGTAAPARTSAPEEPGHGSSGH